MCTNIAGYSTILRLQHWVSYIESGRGTDTLYRRVVATVQGIEQLSQASATDLVYV